ncbi:MAG: Histidyl-tRNA synthetase [Microgenomates group bacterium GW2011_GWF2_45_18]|nr:MAG: Histidyl-tRNA synthetase [Microgenomates group bacterium GW2011_GWF1_44_10]KKU01809.1 MAG: Histidyl-tRNA synthetase [Microgenomates group bacterium GW2011_GWF2_45_18]HAU98887.1 histidine--tRNA ligase [Candidatus Paceibacterota bacterium]HAX01155.1 histidine--tRNA ligase [Candidatus Paceibacterota bacterium]
MTQSIQPLKGFRDFLPAEAKQRQWLKSKMIEIFESWGFDPLETPTLEPKELFAGQIGEDEKLFFSFTDNGGRDVVMRYDQTVPTCRVVGQFSQQLPFPFKRYQIQSAYRAEKPQKGRYREFMQCDADIFGDETPYADAEVIALSLDIYRKLGFSQAIVKMNDRTLMQNIPYEAISSIDKLEKLGRDGVIEDMVLKNISCEEAKQYLKQIETLQPNETINIILNYLKGMGFDESWYRFDPSIARSFSYSTGPIWEVVIPEAGRSSVLGGERFDSLIEKISGKKIAGTGFAVGFDRTLEAAIAVGLAPTFSTSTRVLLAQIDPSTQSDMIAITQRLRIREINAELYTNPTEKLSKQLKYADKKGIPFVLIMGSQEKANGMIQVKDLRSQSQKMIPVQQLDALIDELR